MNEKEIDVARAVIRNGGKLSAEQAESLNDVLLNLSSVAGVAASHRKLGGISAEEIVRFILTGEWDEETA